MIGKTILHYEILAKLGEGGMGVVYKAQDTKLKREVAIKFLPRQIAANNDERERFKIEAQAAAALNHSNIATIHSIEEVDDETFIVMEYIKGKELKDKIDAGPLSIDDTFSIAIQIAQGLQIAHEAGIVHRDIKSTNIMITDRGEVKIMDFGLAKRGDQTRLTKEGTTLGTVAYMSPEQARGNEVDQRSDIFSLGVLIYEMLTGQLPFRGDYDQAVIYSVLNEDPKPVTALRSGMPMELEGIVSKCLRKEPGSRYQNTADLLVDLKNVQENQTRIRKSTLLSKQALRLKPRNWLRILSIGIAMLVIIAYVFWPFRDHESEVTWIAVMPFQFEGDKDWRWLGTAMTDLLNTKLAQNSRIRILDDQEMRTLSEQLGFMTGRMSMDEALQVARTAKTDRLFMGNLVKTGAVIRAQGNLYETGNGNLLKVLEPIEEDHKKVYQLADNLSNQLSEALNIGVRGEINSADLLTSSLDAFRYFIEGKDAALDRRYGESIEKLEKAISLDSTFVHSYSWLAWAYSGIGDDAKAKQTLARGKPYVARLSLEQRLEFLCEEAKYDNRYMDYATYLEQLLRINPTDATVHFRYGWTQFYKFRQLEAGIRAMEKAIELDSLYSWAYNILAYAYLAVGARQSALTMSQKYMALNPADINPLDTMAEIQMLVGEYDAAITGCERILVMQPDFHSALIIQARSYMGQGKLTRARQILADHANQAKDPFIKANERVVAAEIWFVKHEFKKTLEAVDEALAMDPNNLPALWIRGRALLRLEKRDQLADLLKTLESALLAEGGLDQRWLLYHIQGEIAMQDGAFVDAVEWFRKALDLGPLDRAFFLTALAQAYEQSGEFGSAVQNYQSALLVNSNNAIASFGLGRCQQMIGAAEDARNAFERGLDIWSDADQDLPVLIDAKAKLAKLKGIGK